MNKIIIVLCLVLLPQFVHAASVRVDLDSVNSAYVTLLSSETTTGTTATNYCFYFPNKGKDIPIHDPLITATWGGTAPTNITFSIDVAGFDKTNFYPDATVVMTESPTIIHIQKSSIVCMRGNYLTRSGGDATTSLTLTVTVGGL